jgi:hypothetical protein
MLVCTMSLCLHCVGLGVVVVLREVVLNCACTAKSIHTHLGKYSIVVIKQLRCSVRQHQQQPTSQATKHSEQCVGSAHCLKYCSELKTVSLTACCDNML